MTAVPPFNPKQISGCQLWLDGADPAGTGVAPANGATVTTWTDKSGSGNSVTCPSSTYSYNSTTGQSGIYFNSSASSALSLTPTTSFFVSSYGTGPSFPTSYPGLLGSYYVVCYGTYWMGANGYGAGGVWAANRSLNSYGAYLADSRNIALNSVAADPPSAISVRVGAGDSYPGGNQWIGHIYEVILYNTTFSEFQRKQVEGYLAQKWGLRQQLPQEHPGQKGIIYPTIARPLATPLLYQSTFLPTQISGCVLWLDGTDPLGTGTPPSNGTSISTWYDKSGNGNNGTSGTAPSFNSSGINTKGVVSFNGSTTYLNSQDLYSNRSFSIFMVIRRQASIPGFTGLLCGSSGSPNQNMTFAFRNDNVFTLGFYYNDVNYGSFASYTGNTSTEPAYLIEGTYTPGARVLYVNGNFGSSDTNSTNLGSDPGPVIGGYSGQIFNGFIGDIVILNGIPNSTSRQQIEGYLAWKWGIQSSLPGDHAYKSSSPSTTNPFGLTRPTYVAAVVPTPVTKVFPAPKSVIATGGNTIVTANGYKIHTFTTVGSAANFVLSANPGNNLFQVLVVGGGGGGGSTFCGGGGGAGGAVYNSSFTITIGTYTVTVGGGGNGTSTYLNGGASGTDTSFSSLTGYGGGGGGSDSSGAGGASGKSGGCGGGAGYATGVGTGSQGYNGSVGERINSIAKAGGGGGMGSAGTISGGGNGLSYTVGGVTTTYAAGGGGGTSDIAGATLGLGGSSGIGGSGATQSVAATSPSANTGSGGGGGGGGAYPTGTKGADGIVIIAYQYP